MRERESPRGKLGVKKRGELRSRRSSRSTTGEKKNHYFSLSLSCSFISLPPPPQHTTHGDPHLARHRRRPPGPDRHRLLGHRHVHAGAAPGPAALPAPVQGADARGAVDAGAGRRGAFGPVRAGARLGVDVVLGEGGAPAGEHQDGGAGIDRGRERKRRGRERDWNSSSPSQSIDRLFLFVRPLDLLSTPSKKKKTQIQVSKPAAQAAVDAKGSYGAGVGEEWLGWMPVMWALRLV